jgi:hypothetical protein
MIDFQGNIDLSGIVNSIKEAFQHYYEKGFFINMSYAVFSVKVVIVVEITTLLRSC